jgi:hypothetical protein
MESVIHIMELVNVTLDGILHLIVQSNKNQFAQVTVMKTELVKAIILVPVIIIKITYSIKNNIYNV